MKQKRKRANDSTAQAPTKKCESAPRKGHQVEDVLHVIVKLLSRDVEALLSMARTCQTWYSVVAPFLWRQVHVRSFRQRECLRSIFGRNARLPFKHLVEEVRVEATVDVTTKDLQQWLTKLPNLTRITLNSQSRMRAAGIIRLLCNLPHPERLLQLDLKYCNWASATVLTTIARVCPNIRTLNYSWIHDGEGLFAVALHLCHLEALSISGEVSEAAIRFFLLSFDGQFAAATSHLLSQATAGKHLSLPDYEAVVDSLESKQRTLACHRALRKFNISFMTAPAHKLLNAIPSARDTLESLELQWPNNTTCASVVSYLFSSRDTSYNALTELSLRGQIATEPALQHVVESMPNLKVIRMPLDKFNSEVALLLSGLNMSGTRTARGLPKLERLLFTSVSQCSQAAVVRAIQGCPRLQHLEIYFHQTLSLAVLCAFTFSTHSAQSDYTHIDMSARQFDSVLRFFGREAPPGQSITMPSWSYAWQSDLSDVWARMPVDMRPRALSGQFHGGSLERLNLFSYVFCASLLVVCKLSHIFNSDAAI